VREFGGKCKKSLVPTIARPKGWKNYMGGGLWVDLDRKKKRGGDEGNWSSRKVGRTHVTPRRTLREAQFGGGERKRARTCMGWCWEKEDLERKL